MEAHPPNDITTSQLSKRLHAHKLLTLQMLPSHEIVAVWGAVSCYVREELLKDKGVKIVGLGTFFSLEVKVPTGKDQWFLATKPGFQLAKNVVHLHGLTYADMDIPAETQICTMDFTRLRLKNSIPVSKAKACIEETLIVLFHCLTVGYNINFVFKDVGVLSIRGKKATMRFYEDLIYWMDATGCLCNHLLRNPSTKGLVILEGERAARDFSPGSVMELPRLELKVAPGWGSSSEDSTTSHQEQKLGEEVTPSSKKRGRVCPLCLLSQDEFPGSKMGTGKEERRKKAKESPACRQLRPHLGTFSRREEEEGPNPPGWHPTPSPSTDHPSGAFEKTRYRTTQWHLQALPMSWVERLEKKEPAEVEKEEKREENKEQGRDEWPRRVEPIIPEIPFEYEPQNIKFQILVDAEFVGKVAPNPSAPGAKREFGQFQRALKEKWEKTGKKLFVEEEKAAALTRVPPTGTMATTSQTRRKRARAQPRRGSWQLPLLN